MASELDNLERDLPTTDEDIRALRKARQDSRMSATDIVNALAQLPPVDLESLRSRPGLRGEPFRLPDTEDADSDDVRRARSRESEPRESLDIVRDKLHLDR